MGQTQESQGDKATGEKQKDSVSQEDIDKLNAQVKDLRDESAKYRILKNDFMKRNHVLQHILKAHNIKTDVDKVDISKLSIKDNKVEGEVEYTPPNPVSRQEPNVNTNNMGTTITLQSIKDMTADEINNNWDEVSKLLQEK